MTDAFDADVTDVTDVLADTDAFDAAVGPAPNNALDGVGDVFNPSVFNIYDSVEMFRRTVCVSVLGG